MNDVVMSLGLLCFAGLALLIIAYGKDCKMVGFVLLCFIYFLCGEVMSRPVIVRYQTVTNGWEVDGRFVSKSWARYYRNDHQLGGLRLHRGLPAIEKWSFNTTPGMVRVEGNGNGIVVVSLKAEPDSDQPRVVIANNQPTEVMASYDNVLRGVHLKPIRYWEWNTMETKVEGGHIVEYRINS